MAFPFLSLPEGRVGRRRPRGALTSAPHSPSPGSAAGGSGGSLQGEEPGAPREPLTASGLWRGKRVPSRGVSWTPDGTLSLTASLVGATGGMQADSSLKRLQWVALQAVSFPRAAKVEAWGWCSHNYLAFCSRSLSGALSLHSLENTATWSGLRDHPMHPQGLGLPTVTRAVWYSPTPKHQCGPLKANSLHTPGERQRAPMLVTGGCEDPAKYRCLQRAESQSKHIT